MKTLREYIDQLDEISRRDFLKGAGATLGSLALNKAQAQSSYKDFHVYYLLGWLSNFIPYGQDKSFDRYYDVLTDRLDKINPKLALKCDQEYARGIKEGKLANGDKLSIQYNRQQLERMMQPKTFEEEVDEDASPDAVKRIEQLVQYK